MQEAPDQREPLHRELDEVAGEKRAFEMALAEAEGREAAKPERRK